MYRSLKDAVLELDDVLIRTLCGFSIERGDHGYRVVFKMAFYGPDIEALDQTPAGERVGEIAQYPDVAVLLEGSASPRTEIEELSDCRILGELYAKQIPPQTAGNDSDEPKWVVSTHCGSQAERIEWLRSIR